jgi:putative effector of murein hydrolase LrgA (UPF0299 family)
MIFLPVTWLDFTGLLHFNTPMHILPQFTTLLFFVLLGEAVSLVVPWGMPAAVWGILLLFAALCLKIVKPQSIETVADFLGKHMALFFIPPAAVILETFELFRYALFRFLFVCIISTILTFLASYWTVFLVRKLCGQGGRTKK